MSICKNIVVLSSALLGEDTAGSPGHNTVGRMPDWESTLELDRSEALLQEEPKELLIGWEVYREIGKNHAACFAFNHVF